MSTPGVLTAAEVRQFVERGYVPVRGAFARGVADRVTGLLWERLEGERDAPRTWRRPLQSPRLELAEIGHGEVYAPRLTGALDQLLGGGRWHDRGGSWECAFPGFDPPLSRPPAGGWHVDGSSEGRRTLASADQAILLLLLFSDIGSGDGGTALRPGSHHVVGRILADGPEDGERYGILAERLHHVTDWEEAVEVTGAAGDAWLCHGLLYHSRFPNTSQDRVRLLTNRCIALHAPAVLLEEDGAAPSPYERSLSGIRAGARPRTPVPAQADFRRAPRLEAPRERSGLPRPGEDWAVPGVGLHLRWVAPGQFRMGSRADEPGRGENEPLHTVVLTRGFWCGVFPVTQGEWVCVTGANPSRFRGERRPVDTVSWLDCQTFCRALDAAQRARGAVPDGFEYRLLTESEWEYACRAGSSSPTAGLLDQHGWYQGSSGGCTHEVGCRLPNAWGFHDFHGLVWEWCRDLYGPYPDDGAVDPVGAPANRGRLQRGGSWLSAPRFCRSATRSRFSPEYADETLGVRLALGPALRAP